MLLFFIQQISYVDGRLGLIPAFKRGSCFIEYVHKIKIGNVNIDENIFLAPMAGITDEVFRKLCKEQGASMVYSEMVSAKGLYYNNDRTSELMAMSSEERPCAIQIFGSEPEVIAYTCSRLNVSDVDVIDINMGCPAPKVTKGGEGSALMKNPKLVGEIVKAAVGASNKPITVKIRRGWAEGLENAVEIAKIAEANGASAIAVHGRYREQFYKGKADKNIISAVKKAVSIPVIGNGDIFKPDDAKEMFDETGCDAIMVARGAEGNPWIFAQIISFLRDNIRLSSPTIKDKVEMAIRHMDMLIELKGSNIGVNEMRKHIAWYLKGEKHSASIKNEVFQMTDRDEIEQLLRTML